MDNIHDKSTQSCRSNFKRKFIAAIGKSILEGRIIGMVITKDQFESYRDEVISIRRDIHAHPELGFQEKRTAKLVEDYLAECGIQTQRVAKTGVVGLLHGSRPGRTLLLRADMDALPIREETGLPFASQNSGVMHACGHDGHTAILLVAAKILAGMKDQLAGTVKFVFQPNEEIDGASYMVKEPGVLNDPPVDSSFALHLWSPIPSGKIGLQSGAVMAEMYIFKIKIIGRSGHSSTPQDCKDPILCACTVVQNLQSIQTREISALNPTNIIVGKMAAGTAANIIPDIAEIEGSMRYLYDGSDDSPQHPRKRFERLVAGICAAYGMDYELEFIPSNYTVINDEASVAFLKNQVLSHFADSTDIIPYHCMGGEDFSEFTNHNGIPGALVFVGTGNPSAGSDKPHHNAKFTIDEDTLLTGVKLHVFTALEYLSLKDEE